MSVSVTLLACVIVASPARGAPIVFDSRLFYVGDIWLNTTNYGTLGSAPGYYSGNWHYNVRSPQTDLDRLRLWWRPSFEFPGGSKRNYLYVGGLLIGGIIGTDTLVSTAYAAGYPFLPELYANEKCKSGFSDPSSPEFSTSLLGNQTIFSVYSDTAVWPTADWPDPIEGRPHKPLGVEVHQQVLGWSTAFAKRFVILDLWIKNISAHAISKPAIGIVVYPSAFQFDVPEVGGGASMCGFLGVVRSTDGGYLDTLQVVWTADGDGDPFGGGFNANSVPDVMGIRVLNATGMPGLAFNWWGGLVGDDTWGPHLRENVGQFYGKPGRPTGDRDTYTMMTNGEIDYDEAFATHDSSVAGWARPLSDPARMRGLASGEYGDAFMLSRFGGPDWLPGDSVNFCLAFIAGAGFHRNPDDYSRAFDFKDPSRFMALLDFSDLITNARWAEWVRDLPGVDTDSNGYFGEYHPFNCQPGFPPQCDTNWYKGDGVPDWGAPQPPPNPKVEIETRTHRVALRWNGAISETSKDFFSRRRDFEGYRVYNARFNTPTDYALLTSWDIPDDYIRIAYDEAKNTWKQISYPLTVAGWRHELNEPGFDPEVYPKPSLVNAYRDTVIDTVRDVAGLIISIAPKGRLSYWEPQGPNRGNEFGDSDGRVHKNMVQRVAVRDTVIGEDTLQYGVYEFVFEDLNAAIPLWFAVTTMDFGDYRSNVGPQESTPQSNTQFLFPQNSADVVVDSNLQVYTYPNPYKIHFKDAFGNTTSYFLQGYEGAGLSQVDERERRIWFANLPDTATIRIYSLDGDLIREIHHPDKFLTQYNSIVGWDLISRNTQAVTSGIYIWRVDSRLGTQVGKIVIIK